MNLNELIDASDKMAELSRTREDRRHGMGHRAYAQACADLNDAARSFPFAEVAAELRRIKELEDASILPFFGDGYLSELHEVEQILGRALGYPALDESVTDKTDGTVCVGDHTAVTLAREAEKKIKELEEWIRLARIDADGDHP